MKETLKKIGAGLLTLAVIGGASGYLTMSLAIAQPASAEDVATGQTVNETVVVYGSRLDNYASIVAHRKHVGAAGTIYAALQHGRLGLYFQSKPQFTR